MSESLTEAIEDYEANKHRIVKIMNDGSLPQSQESSKAIEEADQLIKNAIIMARGFIVRTMCVNAESFAAGVKEGESNE